METGRTRLKTGLARVRDSCDCWKNHHEAENRDCKVVGTVRW